MQIREHYIESFNQITNKYPWHTSYDHRIPRNITLPEAIGYTNKFIIESEVEHFRYDYYREFLETALTQVGFEPEKNRIMHLDLGCGPGLFSWVVQDYMLKKYGKNPGDTDLIGYDYAENMIHLAAIFQEHLPVEYNLDGYFEIDGIRNKLKSRDFSDYHILITFGHVLIQVKDSSETIQNFMDIINYNMLPSKSCIVVAVDAYSNEYIRQDFKDACKKFWVALNDIGVNVKDNHIGSLRSWMCARLSQEK